MYKDDFPFFANSKEVYLDNAATTQKPKVVVDAVTEYYTNYCANTHRSPFGDANKATSEFEKTREELREFINASSKEEIIFTKGITESLNFIASSYGKKFKTIIISSLEHHSNITPWHTQGRSLRDGLEVVNCDVNLEFDFEDFENKLKQNPNSLVSVVHVSNSFGVIQDIKKIISLAHSYGSKVMIDGAQSLLHVKVDVQALDVDIYAMAGHKTLAPTGVGAVYINKRILDEVAPYQTGGGTIDIVDYDHSTLLSSPFKFEAGTQNIAGIIGFGAALRYTKSVGFENIQKKNEEVFSYMKERLSTLEGIIFYTDSKNTSGSLSFNFEGISHDDIGILVSKMNVALRVGHHCTQPIMRKLGIKGTIRASVAFYNEKEDIDKLYDALKRAYGMLKG